MFGHFEPELVRKATRIADRGLLHRGPDFGAHVAGDAGLLVSRRLAIMDTSSSGHQPMPSQDGRHWLAYNGMLYNYRELRDELRHKYHFRGASDTEVVVAALTHWGVNALRRFEGMFALLWWDEANGEMYAAVDHIGMKPLLYFQDADGNLVCSSELGPLVDLFPQLSVDADTLGTYLAGGLIDHSSRTLIKGVRQLRRGEYLHWTTRGCSVRKYRNLLRSARLPATSDDSLLEALEQSTARHRICDRPFGLSLSSGLDSNLLELLLNGDPNQAPVQSITHCYGDSAHDEVSILELTRSGTFEANIRVCVTPDMVRSLLPGIIGTTLEPVGGLGIFAASCTYKEAFDRGIRVMMVGEGADELFGGYSYYAAQPDHEYPNGSDTGSIVRAPDGTFLNGAALGRDFEFTFVEPEFGSAHELAVSRSDIRGAMWRDLTALKLPKLLRFQDRMSMVHGVEARLPFLDVPVMEASFGIPDHGLVAGETTKVMLRRIERRLGGKAHAAKKFAVPAPQREWIKGELGEWIVDLVRESLLVARGVIDGPVFERQLAAYRASAELGNSFFAWQFMVLELWLRSLRARQLDSLTGVKDADRVSTRRMVREYGVGELY